MVYLGRLGEAGCGVKCFWDFLGQKSTASLAMMMEDQTRYSPFPHRNGGQCLKDSF